MSDSNKRSRSLRPRKSLKKPEFYTESSQEQPKSTASERGESSSASSPKKKKQKSSPKKEKEVEAPTPTQELVSPKGSRKRPSSKSARHKKRRRSTATNLGGCTSLGTGRRSSNRDRSQQRMEENNQSNEQHEQVSSSLESFINIHNTRKTPLFHLPVQISPNHRRMLPLNQPRGLLSLQPVALRQPSSKRWTSMQRNSVNYRACLRAVSRRIFSTFSARVCSKSFERQ